MEIDANGVPPSITLLQIPSVSNTESLDNWIQCKAKTDVDGPTRKNIAVNANQHLSSMNWVIGCSDEGKYHFISPDHTLFSNLFGACLFERARNWGNEDEKEMENEKKKEKEVADDDHNGYITCSL
jgi:hypothetical protein